MERTRSSQSAAPSVGLATIMFPYLICMSLAAMMSGMLNSLRRYFAAAVAPYMPWMLAFSAGAMMYVVVEELIPEAHLGEHSNVGTLGVMAGFLVMMMLDVALG